MSSKKIIEAIKKHKTFLLSTHINSDVDGIACELALSHYLKSLGKKVYIINPDKIAPMYRFINGTKAIEEFHGQHRNYDVAVTLDCGDLDRIDRVQKMIDFKKPLINIDHHITNDFFGTINLVKPFASSTAEVIYDLIKEARGTFSKNMAVLIYLGIMTDTGSFRYDNTTARTHKIVSELMRFKLPIGELYRKIYESIPLKDIKEFLKLMNRFQMSHHNKIGSIDLTKAQLQRFSQEFDLREKIFSFLRSIKGIEAIVIFTVQNGHETRVNFRSHGHIDVAKLASYFKGGGHKKASGCRMTGNLVKARREIFLQLDKIL